MRKLYRFFLVTYLAMCRDKENIVISSRQLNFILQSFKALQNKKYGMKRWWLQPAKTIVRMSARYTKEGL